MTETDIRSQPFSLSRADYTAYYFSSYYRAYLTFPMGPVSGLVVILIVAGLTFGDFTQHHYVKGVLTVLAAIALWMGVIPAIGLATMLRTLSRTPNAYVSRTAIASGPDFTLEGPGFSNRQAWRQFRRAIVSRRMIYLILTTGAAMIVRKSAFATSAECDAFIAACRRHIEDSRDPLAQVFEAPTNATPHPGGIETPPHRIDFGLFMMLTVFAFARGLARPFTGIVAVGLIGFVAWSNRGHLAAGDYSSLVSVGIGIVVWVALFIPGMSLMSWRKVRNTPIIRHPRRLEITPEQIRVHGEGFDVAVNWPAVRKINRRFGAIQFWTSQTGSFAVPLSAFASTADATAFQDQASAWWRAARPAS